MADRVLLAVILIGVVGLPAVLFPSAAARLLSGADGGLAHRQGNRLGVAQVAKIRNRGAITRAMRKTLFSDINGTLVGNEKPLAPFVGLVERCGIDICWIMSRSLRSALEVVTENGLPRPKLIASGVRTCLSDSAEPAGTRGRRCNHTIRVSWTRQVVRSETLRLGWQPQPDSEQPALKASFWLDDTNTDARDRYLRTLHRQGAEARVLVSSDEYIDVLPRRAGKAAVVTATIEDSDLDTDSCVVDGDTEADLDMLTMGLRAVVPANAQAPVVALGSSNRCFVSSDRFAAGVAEGLAYWAAEFGR